MYTATIYIGAGGAHSGATDTAEEAILRAVQYVTADFGNCFDLEGRELSGTVTFNQVDGKPFSIVVPAKTRKNSSSWTGAFKKALIKAVKNRKEGEDCFAQTPTITDRPRPRKRLGLRQQSRHEAAGTFSALAEKGVIYDYGKSEWVLHDDAYRWLDTVWEAHGN